MINWTSKEERKTRGGRKRRKGTAETGEAEDGGGEGGRKDKAT